MMNVFGMTTSHKETLQLSYLFPPQPLENDTLPQNVRKITLSRIQKCFSEDLLVEAQSVLYFH